MFVSLETISNFMLKHAQTMRLSCLRTFLIRVNEVEFFVYLFDN